MYTSQSLQNIVNNCQDEKMQNNPVYDRFLSFNIYSHSIDLFQLLEGRKPLSAIVLEEDEIRDCFYLCQKQKDNSKIVLREIKFDDKEGFNKCGLWYAPINLTVSFSNKELSKENIDINVIDYALLIPCISSHEELNSCYTVVTKKWKTRITAAKLAFPALSFDFISSTLQIHLNATR